VGECKKGKFGRRRDGEKRNEGGISYGKSPGKKHAIGGLTRCSFKGGGKSGWTRAQIKKKLTWGKNLERHNKGKHFYDPVGKGAIMSIPPKINESIG